MRRSESTARSPGSTTPGPTTSRASRHNSRRSGGSYSVLRHELGSQQAHATDISHFAMDERQLSETERYASLEGPNLYGQPLILPATLTRAEAVQPPGAAGTVTLLFSGPVRIRTLLGDHLTEGIALLTRISKEQQVVQWMARDLGSLSVGALGHPPARWLTHYSGAAPWPWPVPEEVEALPRVGLPQHVGSD